MGAGNALQFAADYPDRTLALVLIGAIGQRGGSPAVKDLQRDVATLTDPVDRQFARGFQESTIAQPVAPALIEMFVDESVKVPARVWRAALDGLVRVEPSATMARVRARTLLIWGTRDSVVLRAEQDALLAANRRAELTVYEGAGHAVHWEEPARVAADIAAFVSGITNPTTTGPLAPARR
jgi:pimeloyl-ACP methyl ester carboxylesterase